MGFGSSRVFHQIPTATGKVKPTSLLVRPIAMNVPSKPRADSKDSYWEVTARVGVESEEVWNVFCFELGALGAEVIAEDGGRIDMRHYFHEAPFPTPEAGLERFQAGFPHAAFPSGISLEEKPTQAWDTAWREHFTPIDVGERLSIRPPWQEASPGPELPTGHPARVQVVINPGQGFGTGWHSSTHLALLALESLLTREPPPEALLDVGTGSGILAIAARLLGVRRVHGLDIDGQVMEEVLANFQLSGLPPPDQLTVGRPDALTGAYPLVTANITAPVLLAHREDLARLTDREGWLMVSGVLVPEQPTVVGAFAELGLHLCEERQREGWWCGTLRRSQ